MRHAAALGLVAVVAVIAVVVSGSGVARAEPFVVPPLDARVVDPANRLTATERQQIDDTLAGFRERTGVPIVVFIPASLAGNTIEDVAYQTFNTWKLGDKDRDNGVLIVIAVDERRARIEVGDGLGGALTDLQSNDIIRLKMAPLLAAGQLRPAIDAGYIAIAAAIQSDPSVIHPRSGSGSTGSSGGTDWTSYILFGAIALIVISMLRRRGGPRGPGRRARGRWFGGGVGGWGGWGGGRGGGGVGGGSSGGGGGDFGGGGGHSGGGGSSDSF
jgi:uncharacterized protein